MSELFPESKRGDTGKDQTADPLRGVAVFLGRYWIWLAVATIVAGAIAYVADSSRSAKYSATASLLFRDPGFDQKLFGSQYLAPSRDPEREAATNTALVDLDAVGAKTARALAVPGSRIERLFKIEPAGASDLVRVTATDGDARFAARAANTFANQYISFRRSADRAKLDEATKLIGEQLAGREDGADGRELRALRDRLQILSTLQTGNAELVEPAGVPRNPSSPRPRRSAVFASILGFLAALSLLIIRNRLDRRVRTRDELSDSLGLPLLGEVPEDSSLHTSKSLSGAVSESFRLLRVRLRYFNIDRDLQTFMVTSAQPGEGKSTVAWNLATAFARSGARTLLVEADLRRGSIAQRVGVRSAPGLSDVLTHGTTLDDATRTVQLTEGTDDSGGASVDLLPAGVVPPNPTELLESATMAALLTAMREQYDTVIVDTPPLALVADAFSLVRAVDGVIVVGRLGKSTHEACRHLRDQLERMGAPTLGVVANYSATPAHGGYGYEAYYSPTARA